jgi:hypothetical protein
VETSGNCEGARMETIEGKDIPKAKYQAFSDFIKVL